MQMLSLLVLRWYMTFKFGLIICTYNVMQVFKRHIYITFLCNIELCNCVKIKHPGYFEWPIKIPYIKAPCNKI